MTKKLWVAVYVVAVCGLLSVGLAYAVNKPTVPVDSVSSGVVEAPARSKPTTTTTTKLPPTSIGDAIVITHSAPTTVPAFDVNPTAPTAPTDELGPFLTDTPITDAPTDTPDTPDTTLPTVSPTTVRPPASTTVLPATTTTTMRTPPPVVMPPPAPVTTTTTVRPLPPVSTTSTTTALAPIVLPLPAQWFITSPCHGAYRGACLVTEQNGHPVIYDPIPYPGWPAPPAA